MNPDALEIRFPIWVLATPDGKAKGLIRVERKTGEVACPVFTTKDLAEKFQINNPPLAHYVLAMIKDRASLVKFVDVLRKKGFSRVTIDQLGTTSARLIPLGQLRAEPPTPETNGEN